MLNKYCFEHRVAGVIDETPDAAGSTRDQFVSLSGACTSLASVTNVVNDVNCTEAQVPLPVIEAYDLANAA